MKTEDKIRNLLQEEASLERKAKLKRSVFDAEFYKDWVKKLNVAKLVVINMELNSGNHKTFLIKEIGDSFKYDGKRYIFDPVLKYYNVDFKAYCYDYHEGFDLPLRRVAPVNELKTALKESRLIETEYATNPSTLERFMNSSIIEMMLKGGAVDKMLKFLFIFAMITVVLTAIHLILYMYAQGYFSNFGI